MSDIPEPILGHFCDREQYAMLLRCSEKHDMTEWNEWRHTNPKAEVKLQGADFSMRYFQKANLTKAQCQGANFLGAQFQGARFDGANLQLANLTKTQCQAVTFIEAQLQNAKLDMAQCQWAKFRRAQCQGARFFAARLEKADFWNACCEEAIFWGVHCEEADFSVANCEGATFFGAHCEKTIFNGAHVQRANFSHAHCQKTSFYNTHCEGADFSGVRCQGADFTNSRCNKATFKWAHCEGAEFTGTNCEGARFEETHCEGTIFYAAQFSSSTRFMGCFIDDISDFSCTALESIQIEPGKRVQMEYNIRRFAWRKWYNIQKTYLIKLLHRISCFRRRPRSKIASLLAKALFCLSSFIWIGPVKFFWHVSDYGYSTMRVFKWFFTFIMLFTTLYTFFPWMLMLNNSAMDTPLPGRIFQMLAFATSTMVTLGFSNINVAIENGRPVFAGMFVVTSNLLVGYFMLAVLVTRLGILFHSQGPGEPLKKDKQ